MITTFKNFNEIIEHKLLIQVLEEIKNGKYEKQINSVRKCLFENNIEDFEKRKKLIPAFTPSGKFEGGRKLQFLKEYSKTIILDIDKLNPHELAKTIKIVNNCDYTFASFISPSGNGLKILVNVNTSEKEHKETFIKVLSYYENLVNLRIDCSGSDITRLCFYSYDKNLYLNLKSSIFVSTSQNNDVEILSNFDYENIYLNCIKLTEKKVQFENGSRNEFVYQLACNLNRNGLPINITLEKIQNDFGYNKYEVTKSIKSAYSNVHEFGKNDYLILKKSTKFDTPNNIYSTENSKQTKIGILEQFLSKRYLFRYNIVSSKLEFQYIGKSDWNVMNDYVENSIYRDCLKNGLKITLSLLRNLLNSDFCTLYNPFEDYFENLPKYDEKEDYISKLANTVTTTKQELWQYCFKKWLVAMVGCILNEKVINHTVIVFSGKQGIGKTTWVEKLVPIQLKEYLFSGTINPNNKDTLVQLAECMLINLDELENLNRSEIGSLKEIITKTQIRLRKAYGHNNETMPRRASFAGSVNTAQFLNDSTGSRRFLCFEVENIQYLHEIDIEKVFSQALFLFKNGYKYWFDQEEIKSITDNNEQYQLKSPEEELLLTWFDPCNRENATNFLNASQIASKLSERTKLNLNDSTINKLGKALKKHKFVRLKKEGLYVYAVLEKSYEEVDYNNKIV